MSLSTRVNRLRTRLMWMVLAGTVAGWPLVADAGSTGFRCPTSARLVSLGLSTHEVQARCREPDEIHSTVEWRTTRETVRRWVRGVAQEVTVERTVQVSIDEWIFDFGPNRFVQILRFENGRLISIGEGDKGSGEPE